MPRRTRPLLALLLAAMAALALAACGEDGEAAADRDPDALLSDTFAPGQRIESGRVALDVRVEPRGDRGEAFALELSGPFQTNGERRLPSVDLDVHAGGSGQDIAAGVVLAEDAAFLEFQGQAYRVPDPMFRAFRAAYEQAQAGGGSAPLLGLEASSWILDPQIAGEATVGDAETIRIRGGVNVERMLADLHRALRRATALGGGGTGPLPDLSAGERERIAEQVIDPRVEVFTGREDGVLRRLVVAFGLEKEDGDRADVRLDLTFTDVGEDQDIEPPADARPLDELAQGLGGLGLLGPLGGAGSGGGKGGADRQERRLERYTECIREAGSDAEASRRCAELLTAP